MNAIANVLLGLLMLVELALRMVFAFLLAILTLAFCCTIFGAMVLAILIDDGHLNLATTGRALMTPIIQPIPLTREEKA